MDDLSTLEMPALTKDPGSEVRARLDQLERAVADTLAQLEPGHRSAAAVHEQMQRLVLTDAVLMGLSPHVSPSALASAMQQLQPSNVIDEALKKTTQAHVEALGRAGLVAPVLELLQSWVEVMVDARVLQRQIELRRAIDTVQGQIALRPPAAPTADPTEPLSAAELGQALGGLSDETVRQRERAGELFSILRPGRKRGREYPAFQAWPGLAGEPLAKILAALGPVSSTVAYGFFTSPTDLLGGLTPIETTLGQLTSPRSLDAPTQALLAAVPLERLAAVVKAAQAHAALQAA